MAEYQALARMLSATGGAFGLDGEGTYFLDTEGGNLSIKLHTGEQWGDEEIIADDARPSSAAAYILTPSTNLIIYINTDSKLRALKYDEDNEEWAEDASLPDIEVHEEGKLATCGVTSDSTETIHIFYQNPSGSIVALDGSWKSSVVPVQPLIGTPINLNATDEYLDVGYISAKDSSLHVVSRAGAGEWVDEVVAKSAFSDPIKRFVSIKNIETGQRNTYALTVDGAVVHVNEKGEVEVIGKVDEDGKYAPKNSAQNVTGLGIWDCGRRGRRGNRGGGGRGGRGGKGGRGGRGGPGGPGGRDDRGGQDGWDGQNGRGGRDWDDRGGQDGRGGRGGRGGQGGGWGGGRDDRGGQDGWDGQNGRGGRDGWGGRDGGWGGGRDDRGGQDGWDGQNGRGGRDGGWGGWGGQDGWGGPIIIHL